MTPDELLRQRKQQELLARANAAKNTAPSADEALVSDNTKQTLKAAGHWASVLSKRAVEATKQGATLAADKTKAAAAAASEKAKQAQDAATAKREAALKAKAASAPEASSVRMKPDRKAAGPIVTDGMGRVEHVPVIPRVEPGTAPLDNIAPADVSHALTESSDPIFEEPIEPSRAFEPAMHPNKAPLPDDPMGELPPLPDDAYSEAATEAGNATDPAPRRRRWILALLAVSVVGVGVAAFAWLGRDEPSASPMPSTAPSIDEAPASSKPEPLPAPQEPVSPPAPEPVAPVPVQPETVEPSEVDVVTPSEPEQPLPPPTSSARAKPTTPSPATPRAAAASERRPATRNAQRTPSNAPANAPEWQRQADADLDAWAKRAGLD